MEIALIETNYAPKAFEKKLSLSKYSEFSSIGWRADGKV